MSEAEPPEELDFENLDEYSEAEIEAYNEQKNEEMEQRIREKVRNLDETQQEALEKLGPAEDDTTEEVKLGAEAVVEVQTHLEGWIEDEVETIFEETTSAETYRTRMPRVMAAVIQDDDYADQELWRAYAESYGTKELTLRFLEAIEPMMESAEDADVVRRFRKRQQRTD